MEPWINANSFMDASTDGKISLEFILSLMAQKSGGRTGTFNQQIVLSARMGDKPQMTRGVEASPYVPRGEVSVLLDGADRAASRLIAKLRKVRVVESSGQRNPLRLGFTTEAAGNYFQKIYPVRLA